MRFAKKTASTVVSPVEPNELVSVSLKVLIELAKPAASLKLHRLTIRAQQSGGYLSAFKGRGMEFDENRLYQQGDDIRSIDWRVTARTGKTYTKLFREEREKPVFIAVDNRPAMQFATRGVFKSVQAKKLAALLAWVANHQGDKIGGQVFSQNTCHELKPQNGKHAVLHFLNALVVPDNGSEAIDFALPQALARLTQHARPGSLVYIISDFRGLNTKAENLLLKLSEHCDVVLVFVYDPLEKALPTQGRYRFTDHQAQQPREVVIDSSDKQKLSYYQLHFAERLQKLKNIALRRGLALLQCSTQDDPVQCLRHPLESR